MVLPLRDANPTRRVPVLTIALIAVNVAVFVWQSTLPNPDVFTGQRQFDASQSGLLCRFGLIADELLHGTVSTDDPFTQVCAAANDETPRPGQIVTHQFLHGDLLHLLGNMLFLWVFGNNVEDRLGRVRFLPFYLLCGILAALGQVLIDPGSTAVLIGASGAISGVLGAYFVLYPRARVLTLVTIVPLRLPAWIVLGLYIAFQFVYVSGPAQDGDGGVAYWAHIFGFAAGLLLIRPMLAGRPAPRPPNGWAT